MCHNPKGLTCGQAVFAVEAVPPQLGGLHQQPEGPTLQQPGRWRSRQTVHGSFPRALCLWASWSCQDSNTCWDAQRTWESSQHGTRSRGCLASGHVPEVPDAVSQLPCGGVWFRLHQCSAQSWSEVGRPGMGLSFIYHIHLASMV